MANDDALRATRLLGEFRAGRRDKLAPPKALGWACYSCAGSWPSISITLAANEWKYVADVQMDFDPQLHTVPCMAGRLNQVLLNILINAAHAIADEMGEGAEGKGTIAIITRRDGDFAEIRISDTGTGIPEEARPKIFEPFFTTKDVGKGTGQGLSLAHGVVVKEHGGTLDFETEIGVGTTFVIRLPLERRA